MLRLLADKDLEKISITELVHVAGVSRTAFYSNYSSKDDVLSSIISQVCEDFVNLIWPYALKQDFMELFRQLFKRIKEEYNLVYISVKANFNNILSRELEKSIINRIKDFTRKEQLLISGFFGFFISILMEWMRNDMKDDIEDLSILCYDFLPDSYK